MSEFLSTWARRYLPILVIPAVLVWISPGPPLAKILATLTGVAVTMFAHYFIWVIYPKLRRRKSRDDEPPADS